MAGADHKQWPWYPKDVGDYRADTNGLSMEQHGAYNLLMDEYYHTGRPLPGDFEAVARIVRAVTDGERGSLQAVLERYFDLRNGKYWHKRIDQELDKRRQLSEARQAAARGRWKRQGA